MAASEHSQRSLRDIGEFGLLESIVFPTARRYKVDAGLGDDCGFVEIGTELIAVSADAGPKPLIQELPGHEADQEAAGWHAVVATASDLATAGAKPLFLVDTIDAPVNLPESQLQAFLDGYFRACSEFGFKTAGGDIRQGASLTARVFGAGLVQHGVRIGRGGVLPGDHIVILGSAGAFITAFLVADRLGSNSLSTEDLNLLRFPCTQIEEMQILAKHNLIVAASDSSDGVLGALENVGRRSSCGFDISLNEDLLLDGTIRESGIRGLDPWNMFFCWGDWSIVAAIPQRRLTEFTKIAEDHKIAWSYLGHATQGPFSVRAKVNGNIRRVNVLRNENFRVTGFREGIRGHVTYMLSTKLFYD